MKDKPLTRQKYIQNAPLIKDLHPEYRKKSCNTPIWVSDVNSNFTKEKRWLANEHRKRCSVSSSLGKYSYVDTRLHTCWKGQQHKETPWQHQGRAVTRRSSWNPQTCWVGRHSSTVTLENSVAISCKVKYTSLYDPAILLLDEMKTCPHEDFYMNVHSSFNDNSPKAETTQMSTNWRMNTQIVV